MINSTHCFCESRGAASTKGKKNTFLPAFYSHFIASIKMGQKRTKITGRKM
jgi:hypothetical protein